MNKKVFTKAEYSLLFEALSELFIKEAEQDKEKLDAINKLEEKLEQLQK